MTRTTAADARIGDTAAMLRQIIPLIASLSTLVATLYAFVTVA